MSEFDEITRKTITGINNWNNGKGSQRGTCLDLQLRGNGKQGARGNFG
jgi:hypothetical protein